METWPEPVERVAAVLRARGVDARVEEFPQGDAVAQPATTDATGELERLAALHESGAISDAEFEAAKKSALT